MVRHTVLLMLAFAVATPAAVAHLPCDGSDAHDRVVSMQGDSATASRDTDHSRDDRMHMHIGGAMDTAHFAGSGDSRPSGQHGDNDDCASCHASCSCSACTPAALALTVVELPQAAPLMYGPLHFGLSVYTDPAAGQLLRPPIVT